MRYVVSGYKPGSTKLTTMEVDSASQREASDFAEKLCGIAVSEVKISSYSTTPKNRVVPMPPYRDYLRPARWAMLIPALICLWFGQSTWAYIFGGLWIVFGVAGIIMKANWRQHTGT